MECRPLSRRRLNRLAPELLEEPFHQILPLDHQVPQLMLLRSSHFPPQGRQVVVQQVAQNDGFVIREKQLHSSAPHRWSR
jgi:hypothetical protein